MSSQDVSNTPMGSYPVTVSPLADGSLVQHMRLDIGVGTSESVVTAANPLPVSITSGGGGDATAANQVIQIANDALILAEQQTQTANQVTQIANEALIIAEQQTQTANQVTQINNDALLLAEQQGQTANQVTQIANQALVIAEQQAQTANQVTQISNEAAILANQLTQISNEALMLAVQESQNANTQVLQDLVQALKQIRKTLEPSATQDALQRQRVVVESYVGGSGIAHGNLITQGSLAPTVGWPTIGSSTYQTVWEGPVDQRWRVADAARTMAYLQRQNLTFS